MAVVTDCPRCAFVVRSGHYSLERIRLSAERLLSASSGVALQVGRNAEVRGMLQQKDRSPAQRQMHQ